MSNDKKKKKAKNKMKPETKDKIKLGFLSLINNEACIKIGRNWHWYFPVIAGIFAILLALIPSFTQNMQVKVGNNLLQSNSYGFENGLVHFGEFLEEKNADLVIEDGVLTDQIEGKSTWAEAVGGEGKWYTATNVDTGATIFEVFFNNADPEVEDLEFANRVIGNKDPYTNLARGEEEDASYANSAIVFGKKTMYLYKVGSNGTSVGQAMGQYDRDNGLSIASLAQTSYKGEAYEEVPGTLEYTNAVRDSWRRFVNSSSETQKNIQALTYLGIMAAVYVALAFVFGLVLFLMTRGKKNPLRIYTFWETQKMAYVAALCPGILSLALGFLISSFALFMFIFVYGIRIMWMSMKSLKAPTY